MAARTTATRNGLESTAKATQVPAKSGVETEHAFQQIDRIYHAIARRAFEIFSNNPDGFGRDNENWFKAESELLHPVHVMVTEEVGAVHVSAEVPGFEARNIEIKLEPNRVSISGKRETKEERNTGRTVYHEHCANEILRVIDLPAVVDASKAEASLQNGVLEIRMPKGKAAKTTRLQVKAS
jgi:HSP20 family protein